VQCALILQKALPRRILTIAHYVRRLLFIPGWLQTVPIANNFYFTITFFVFFFVPLLFLPVNIFADFFAEPTVQAAIFRQPVQLIPEKDTRI
jgi:hypothetical protein